MSGEPMQKPRGYFAAGVINESIFVMGGIVGENILETVSYILLWFPSFSILFLFLIIFLKDQITDPIHVVYL